MTVLIGKERAELFATAHEDKDVTGTESDGYPKTAHRDMDLHNNEVGREIGEKIKKLLKVNGGYYLSGNIFRNNIIYMAT